MRNTSTKPDVPRLAGRNFEDLKKFLRSGRSMNEKAIGVSTTARLLCTDQGDSILVYAYGFPIVELQEGYPDRVRFRIYFNAPSDRGRISQFLPEGVNIRGYKYLPHLYVDGSQKILLDKNKEYVWHEEYGLQTPTDKRLV